ncbi:GNAT family N-acetyltransferase [Rhodoplanes elegans]|uniref:GNAT family N-acetyltransferase n=1 Tax=Rhodoplanes elegans TaxID=29408 RepID=A0A327KGN8_9BRAD|nr:GNAT family N-acetyltransferase [Rhodoplanes elegans]MBK5959155.1 GNAT family N-acetyltransferase [Rhodoplanes elegans]RAI37256.1 GNAT family N-acetyltransferase [Rhodoplanes elegans]
MATAHPEFALRPVLPADTPLLAEIFRASVEELTGDDYSEAQQEAWMTAAADEAAFAKRVTDALALVVTLNGTPVGFVTLVGGETIDLLYVHPGVVGMGAGAMLIDAIEKLAGARGAKTLVVDASDNARNFFEKRGYVAQRRNTVLRGDEWLANTTMEKALAGKVAT